MAKSAEDCNDIHNISVSPAGASEDSFPLGVHFYWASAKLAAAVLTTQTPDLFCHVVMTGKQVVLTFSLLFSRHVVARMIHIVMGLSADCWLAQWDDQGCMITS